MSLVEPADAAANAARAHDTWLAMRRLCDARSGLYHEPAPADHVPAWLAAWLPGLGRRVGRRGVASLWPFANAWAATRALATLEPPAGGGTDPGASAGDSSSAEGASWREVLDAHMGALGPYALPGTPLDPADAAPLRLEAATFHPPGGRGDAYYDDNAWVALDLFAQHDLTGDPRCLALARRVLDFVLSGWSDDPALASPGGIRWAEPAWSTTRNTCSNAPAAEAAALAHLRSDEPGRLDWARRIVDWVDATLRSESGLYFDRVEPDGTVRRDLWAYNQGTMLGANVLLFEATGEAAFLEGARAIAAAAASWLEPWEVLVGQPPEFLAIYLRNLLLLADHAAVATGVGQIARFAQWAWEHQRDRNGLFRTGKLQLNTTAGMTALYALLAGATPAP